jgi:hypothetical protein
MATTCYELTGSMTGIGTDTELVFPNVQTCVAVVAVVGQQLVGAHVTLADRSRLAKVAEKVKEKGMPSDLYAVGPILSGNYNVSSFANFGGTPHICDTPGFIDVRARLVNGTVLFERRPAGSGGWTEIKPSEFVS